MALARDGWNVAVSGRRPEPLAATVTAIEAAGSKGLAVATDVSKPDQVEALFAATIETFGRLDLLFNNAGIGSAKALLEHNPEPTEEEIRFELSGNLCRCTGYDKIIRAVQAASGRMKEVS